MTGHSGYQSWFIPAYLAVFGLFTALAAWWMVDVVRRPAESFPGSWPAPRLRWGLVPAAWLLVVGAQMTAWLVGLVLRAAPAAAKLVTVAGLGLATAALFPIIVIVGVAYLLRVVFPRTGRGGRSPDEGDEEEPDDGADAGDAPG